MNHTYTTTAQGIQVPMGETRNPAAQLHFARVNTTNTGAQVWECRTIRGRHLSLRLTFTSRFTDEHVRLLGFPMGELLYREMIKQEEVSEWESQLSQGWNRRAAVA